MACPREVRNALLERSRNKCEDCGADGKAHKRRFGKGLEAHRVQLGVKYSADVCRFLCKKCHGVHHRGEMSTAAISNGGRLLEKVKLAVSISQHLREKIDSLKTAKKWTLKVTVETILDGYFERGK